MRLILLIACLWIAEPFSVSTQHAQRGGAPVFEVDTTVDAIDADSSDAICATAAGACSLRAAIQQSNAIAGPARVILPPGLYVIGLVSGGEDSAFGDFDITNDLTLSGSGAGVTIIEAAGRDRLFEISAQVDMSGVTLRGGSASAGGGVLNRGSLAIEACVIRANEAILRGGGIHSLGALSIFETTIEANMAETGGGIHHSGPGELSVEGSTFSNNIAARGGGIFVGNPDELNFDSADASIINSTLSGNIATDRGGGVFQSFASGRGSGEVMLLHSTLTANSAPGGGAGLYRASEGEALRISHAIISGNSPGGDCAGEPIASEGRNIDGDGSCMLSGDGDQSSLALGLGPLAANGGPTLTHALSSGSRAIDAGDNRLAPATDQRGAARPVDGDGDSSAISDIGAFEFGSIAPTPTPGPINPNAAAGWSLYR